MGTTVVTVMPGGTKKEVGKYAKSARSQRRAVKRQISASQKKIRREKRGVKIWRVVKRLLAYLVIGAQFVGSVLIVAALFRTEVLTMWQNGLVIMGLTMLLFLDEWILL